MLLAAEDEVVVFEDRDYPKGLFACNGWFLGGC